MTIQYASSCSSDASQRQLLLQKLRSNLISLRQFEECYVLARWIRNLFKGTMSQWQSRSPSASPPPEEEADGPGTEQNRFYETSIGSPPELEQAVKYVDHIPAFDMDFFYMMPEDEDQMITGFPFSGSMQDSHRNSFMDDLH